MTLSAEIYGLYSVLCWNYSLPKSFNVNHDKTSVFENTPAHTPPSLSLARYFEQVCGSGHKHFPLTILARNVSIGSALNGASGSATKSEHCVGMHGAASPSPSQHETSSPLGCGFVPSVVPHAWQRRQVHLDGAKGASPALMCTGYQVVLTRTAVAESEGLDRLYGPTDSFLLADTSNESVSSPPWVQLQDTVVHGS